MVLFSFAWLLQKFAIFPFIFDLRCKNVIKLNYQVLLVRMNQVSCHHFCWFFFSSVFFVCVYQKWRIKWALIRYAVSVSHKVFIIFSTIHKYQLQSRRLQLQWLNSSPYIINTHLTEANANIHSGFLCRIKSETAYFYLHLAKINNAKKMCRKKSTPTRNEIKKR